MFPALRKQNSCPGSDCVTICMSTRESAHEITTALGLWPFASSLNSARFWGKTSERKRQRPLMILSMGFLGGVKVCSDGARGCGGANAAVEAGKAGMPRAERTADRVMSTRSGAARAGS
jgi:hypothetical protein